MEWKFYFRNIVQRYSVKIEGWPFHLVRFQNLSEVSSPYGSLKTLLNNWITGKTRWIELGEDELEELVREREEQVANGEIQEPAQRRPRSDRGKKRRHVVEHQADEDEDESNNGSSDEDGDQPRRKRAKRAAAQKAQARMGRNSAGKMSAVNGGDPAEAEADDDDYDDDD